MVFEERRRSSEGLWAEEDIGFRLEELVCLPCGHSHAAQTGAPGLRIEGLISSRLPALDSRSRISPVTFDPESTAEKTFHHSAQHSEWTPGRLPGLIDRAVLMSRAGTARLLEYIMQDLPEQGA